jgi:peptidoglycan/LPS O-acetylase OafA/YrhL
MEKSNRFLSLDSLRGIACLQVVLGHCFYSLPATGWIYYKASIEPAHNLAFYLAYSPLHFFVSGPNAVKVFFILSGFVLSLPFFRTEVDARRYTAFFVKRIIRIYLPCVAVICLALAVKKFIYHPETAAHYGKWMHDFLSGDFTGFNLVKTFLLLDPVTNLIPVIWTLPPEIKLSLLLPFFVYLLNRANVYLSMILLFGTVLLYKAMIVLGMLHIWPDFATMYYLPFFLLGAVVCKYKNEVTQWINTLGNAPYYLLLIISLYVYTFTFSCWWLPSAVMRVLEKYEDYVVGLPGLLFLIFALSRRLESLLSSSFLVFVGKISFSLYLVHHIVILSMVYTMGSYLNQYLVIGLGLVFSFLFAYLFYKWVEVPSIALAKKASDRVLTHWKTAPVPSK